MTIPFYCLAYSEVSAKSSVIIKSVKRSEDARRLSSLLAANFQDAYPRTSHEMPVRL